MSAKRNSTTNETALVRACLHYLHIRGVVAWRANTGANTYESKGTRRFVRFGPKGQADIMGVMPPNGRALAIECKMRNRPTTAQQRAFLEHVRAAGGLSAVVHDVEELSAVLDG
ncbi:MAG: hypothetical protein AB1508_18915 [Pseudomonadota bacterium]